MERETAMKILKELHDNSLFSNRIALETLIPELADSNDERIRKALVRFHKSTIDIDGIKGADILAWLEKQGNNTPTIIWHNIDEKPEEMKELFCEWESDDATWHDVAFYDEESHTFRHAKMPINVTKWVYVDELLEKQGEQKPAVTDFNAKDWYVSKVDGKIHDMTYNPADKVEPKFKVGDYIVNDYCMGRVVEITNDAYLLDTEQGIPFSCKDNVHLWTIQDAKDGDVLINTNVKYPFIFKETKPSNIKTDIPNPLTILGYCGIGGAGFTKSSGWGDTVNCTYYPATKEQRDLLFQKMKEAGWKWNDSTKELKKINSYCQENCKGYQETGKCFANGECDAKRKAEQESAEWSDEDERMLHTIIVDFKGFKHNNTSTLESHFNACIDWLKSLKDRIGG